MICVTLVRAGAAIAIGLAGVQTVAGQEATGADGALVPDTITITTGGGRKIDERPVDLLRKTRWRFEYPDAPAIESLVNESLAASGYDVREDRIRRGWFVSTRALGDACSFEPPVESGEEARSAAERQESIMSIIGTGVGMGPGPGSSFAKALVGSKIATTKAAIGPYYLYLSRSMLEGLPPRARKILVTLLSNSLYRAEQEIITVAYSDISDDDLRRVNARYILEMIKIKTPMSSSNELLDARDVCPEAPAAYYTGRKPETVKPVQGMVVGVREIDLRDQAAAGNEIEIPRESLVELSYAIDGDIEPKRVLLPLGAVKAIAVTDRVRIAESLFMTKVAKVNPPR